MEHGFVDKIVERKDQKKVIGQILYMHRHHRMNVDLPVGKTAAAVDNLGKMAQSGGKT